MKINEVTNSLKHYMATVRVVTGNGIMTARTSITADTQQQARAIMTRVYGTGNVFSVSEAMHESPRTYQIHAQATIPTRARHRPPPTKKIGPVQLSCVAETEGTKTLTPAELQVKSLADQAKRLNQQASMKKAQTKLAKAQDKLRIASAVPK